MTTKTTNNSIFTMSIDPSAAAAEAAAAIREALASMIIANTAMHHRVDEMLFVDIVNAIESAMHANEIIVKIDGNFKSTFKFDNDEIKNLIELEKLFEKLEETNCHYEAAADADQDYTTAYKWFDRKNNRNVTIYWNDYSNCNSQ